MKTRVLYLAITFMFFAWPAFSKVKSKTTIISDGAINRASTILQSDSTNINGINLLQFGLKLSPKNETGLYIQGCIENNVNFKAVSLEVEDKVFIDSLSFLSKSLRKIGKRSKANLYLSVILLVDSSNKYAMVKLTEEKNSGINTTFADLFHSTYKITSEKTAKKTPRSKVKKQQVYTSSKVGSTGTVNQGNIYVFNLQSIGKKTLLQYYASGDISTETAGEIFITSPSEERNKIGEWKTNTFKKTTNSIKSYKELKPQLLNISSWVKTEGEYRIEFQYTNGVSMLKILRVSIRTK